MFRLTPKNAGYYGSRKTMAYITDLKPEVIFHCAAYTAVDKAEDEGKELG